MLYFEFFSPFLYIFFRFDKISEKLEKKGEHETIKLINEEVQ